MYKSHNDKDESPDNYYSQRREQMQELQSLGVNIYPHKFYFNNTFQDVFTAAETCSSNEKTNISVELVGRVIRARIHSMTNFYDVKKDNDELQIVYNKNLQEKENSIAIKIVDCIRRGDIIGFKGIVGRTKTGEISVFAHEIQILSPCLRAFPSEKNLITNPELIYRHRHIDLLVNQDSRNRFITRSKIIQHIREYFNKIGFLEVETPIMNNKVGGASARPFLTHHNELKIDLYLRVAPELFLKQLVVGGLERVFEIGKNFRNEGIDLTHNPEFTAIEFYMAYADYNDLMCIVEELLSSLVKLIKGSSKFTYQPCKRETIDEIKVPLDFSTPFKRIDILEELNKSLNIELTGENIEKPETLELLIKKAEELNIMVNNPKTLNRMLDAFIGEYIEPQCINPTFVTGFPICMSPLAKDHRNKAGITERFELFCNGKELVNAYTELNIPDLQRKRFLMQDADANAGDDEAMPNDEDFCQVLEYGLPPTGGCGIGIDRLVMYLTDAANIRDVILFPTLKPEQK